MSILEQYLQTNTLGSLSKLHIKVCYHNILPLAILTYNNILSPKTNPLVSICRGLVIELNSWKVISQGMSRFDNFESDEVKLVTAEIKEDGTLLHIFNYKGSWLLATRHNFGEDYVNNDQTQTYKDIFEQICGCQLQELGSKLNPSITYCIEMCSLHNRIIRKYNKSVIYLLACYENGIELFNHQVNFEAGKVGWLTPTKFAITNINDCDTILQEQSADCLFEGFVIRDTNNNRYKFKNPFYVQIHKLKYRNWKSATAQNLVPLLINHSDKLELIYEVLIHNHTTYDMIEYKKRFTDCERKLNQMKLDGIDLTTNNFIDRYGILDPFIDHVHARKYCTEEIINKYQDTGLSKDHPTFKDNEWQVHCYCGSKMYLHRTKVDYLIYNKCQVCDCNFDIKVYSTGTLIWLCNKCYLTHDAHQNNHKELSITKGQPTGIPCSDQCKNLRLTIHQIFSDIQNKNKMTKNQIYQLLADLLGISRESTHVALFDIPLCIKSIELLNKELIT